MISFLDYPLNPHTLIWVSLPPCGTTSLGKGCVSPETVTSNGCLHYDDLRWIFSGTGAVPTDNVTLSSTKES